MLVASEWLAATATQSLSSFNLDVTGLTVEAIRVNGRPDGFSRVGQELTVTPSKPLRDNHRFVVSLDSVSVRHARRLGSERPAAISPGPVAGRRGAAGRPPKSMLTQP